MTDASNEQPLDVIQAKGVNPLKDVLRQMGGWPVLEGAAWDSSGFQWAQNVYINRQLGFSLDYLFDFSVSTNIRNSTWRIIDVSTSYIFLSCTC